MDYSTAMRVPGCGQWVRSCGVNVLCRYEGPWVWSVSEKLWGLLLNESVDMVSG